MTPSNLLPDSSTVLNRWKNELPAHLIDDGLHIIQQFGLDEFYDENSIPNMNILSRIQNTV